MTPPADTRTAEVADLETRLQLRLAGRARDLRLLVRDEGLVLRGRARTYYAKQIAQHAVMEAVRIPIAANEIEVT